MRRILFVVPSLEYGGAARQATLLAMGLARDRFLVEVCVLGKMGPWKEELIRAGVAVTTLGWRRWMDARPLARLRERIRTLRPHVIHVYKPAALRAVMAARIGLSGRLVASSPWGPSTQRFPMNLVDRRLLCGVDKVVAGSPFEAGAYRTFGLREGQIAEIAPGVALDPPPVPAPTLRESLGLAPEVRLIAGVGPLDADKGFKNAVWAFDILQFLFDDLHLLVIGGGSERARVQRFAQAATLDDKVHFLGPQPDVLSLLAQMDIVWVPSRGNTGINAALEGMAAGRPVVASSRPVLAELIRHGQTGILVPPNDQGALARQTRLLLDDPDRRRQLGDAARKQVQDRHDAALLVKRCESIYERITG
jgi:glycosyltransferase involved in cell wall biosynthesis